MIEVESLHHLADLKCYSGATLTQASAFIGEVLGKEVVVERPVSATTSASNYDGLDGSSPAAKIADLTASVLAESFFIGQKVSDQLSQLPSTLGTGQGLTPSAFSESTIITGPQGFKGTR